MADYEENTTFAHNIQNMKKLIFIFAGLLALAACQEKSHQGIASTSDADSIYTYQYISMHFVKEPERCLGLIDTAEMKGTMTADSCNMMRGYVYYSGICDREQGKHYMRLVLDRKGLEHSSDVYISTLAAYCSLCLSQENGEAAKVCRERLDFIDEMEQKGIRMPAGYYDKQRGGAYCVLAFCELELGHKPEARRAVENFEKTLYAATPSEEYEVRFKTQEAEMALKEKEAQGRIHLILIIALATILVLGGLALWRIIKDKRLLNERNRDLYKTIQQMLDKEKEAEQTLEETPTTALSASQQLYQSIVKLMVEQKPYTSSNMNRDSLAQMMNTNYNLLANAIRECANGQSIGDFIEDWRLRHAAQLLAETDKSIGLVMEESGFASRSHFNTLFRERFKMTPSEYRKVTNG